MNTTGTQFFTNEDEMDVFLEDLQPGSTVVIRDWRTSDPSCVVDYQATWFPGKNITKSEYYPNGIGLDDGDIYWYTKDRLWQLIPAF